MTIEAFRILVLGGYGNFGKRICQSLAKEAGIQLVVAGRNMEKASQLSQALQLTYPDAQIEGAGIDIHSPNFEQELRELGPDLVIHTSGPFQGQSYRVPEACIEISAHYIDLADDRRFVCDITQLDQQASKAGVLLVSGASSVPGLSSAVIDHYAGEFSELEHIEYAIAPGNRLERGVATIRAILSYTGKPFAIWRDSQWRQVYGWMDSIEQDFGPPIGVRSLANIDIPDLELFPKRYAPVKTVRFRAGLELKPMHQFMVFMAWLVKRGVVSNWAPYAGLSLSISNWFYGFGTDIGGMRVHLKGKEHGHQPKQYTWTLIAEKGVGPYIPTIAAILVARKLRTKRITKKGALPCIGLFSLDEFMQYDRSWGIYDRLE